MTSPRARRDVVAFLAWVQGECAAAGVRLVLLPTKIKPGFEIGSFDYETRKLSVCVAREDWVTTLAHEAAHLRQFVERRKWFEKPASEFEEFEAWIHGKRPRLKLERVRLITRSIQKLEADAERRTVKLIRHFHLLPDEAAISKYVREANLYLLQHEACRRIGFWPSYGMAVEHLIAAMPNSIIADADLGKLPEPMETLAMKA